MSQVASKVVEIIVDKLSVNAEEVVPAANFQNDLGADSLDTVELIMEFEKAFDISLKGAKIIKQENRANQLLKEINGSDSKSTEKNDGQREEYKKVSFHAVCILEVPW